MAKKNPPPLPFSPQSTKKLIERFPLALEKIWEVTEPMLVRPGQFREYVFDFQSGLRLLISRTRFPPNVIRTQVSASWEYNAPISFNGAAAQVESMYQLLSGKLNARLDFIGFSPRKIPHWLVKETGNEYQKHHAR